MHGLPLAFFHSYSYFFFDKFTNNSHAARDSHCQSKCSHPQKQAIILKQQSKHTVNDNLMETINSVAVLANILNGRKYIFLPDFFSNTTAKQKKTTKHYSGNSIALTLSFSQHNKESHLSSWSAVGAKSGQYENTLQIDHLQQSVQPKYYLPKPTKQMIKLLTKKENNTRL